MASFTFFTRPVRVSGSAFPDMNVDDLVAQPILP